MVSHLPLSLQRYGYSEYATFIISYSPLRDDSGAIEGVLATVVETTSRVLAQRRIEFLRHISFLTSATVCRNDLMKQIGNALESSEDMGFARIYLAEDGSEEATLAVETGVSLLNDETAKTIALDDFVRLQQETYRDDRVVFIPIVGPDRQKTIGALIVGANPHLRLDDAYEQFMTLLAGQIGNSLAAVRAFEDERSRAELLQVTRTIEQIGLFAESGQQLFWTTDAQGRFDWFHRSWFDYTGQAEEEAYATGGASAIHPEDVAEVLRRWQESVAAQQPFEMTFRMCDRDGHYRWFLTRAVPDRDTTGKAQRWYGTNTNIDAERRATQQFDVLSHLGNRLVQTLDRERTFEALLDALIPELADWSLINLLDASDNIILVAARHRDPEKMLVLSTFIGSSYEQGARQTGARISLRTGRGNVYEYATPGEGPDTVTEAFAAAIEHMGLTSAIVVPIVSSGKVVGTFHALSSGNEKRYNHHDLPFYLEIGRRIGYALHNAEAYQREARIARTFQNAALPNALPTVLGLQFSALYEPASSDANVGGDFYDAFRLLDGRVVVSIGDVLGSGIDAAATMAALRQSIRAAASINPYPDLLLKAAEGAFGDSNRSLFASAFVAVIDPLSLSIQYANAGHPAPLLRHPDGTVVALKGNDMLLGVVNMNDFGARQVGKLSVEPGSTLVLYTDGLTEATHNLEKGEARLEEAVHSLMINDQQAKDAAQQLYHSVLYDVASVNDDVAILAVHFAEDISPEIAQYIYHWHFAADDGTAARTARIEMSECLERCELTADDIFSAQMIFSELIGNVLRHANGSIEIILDVSEQAPVLHVMDTGNGFSLNPKLPADFYAEHGRGLYIVMQLAREFTSTPRTMAKGSHVRVVLRGTSTLRRRTRNMALR
jgi:PAS domain S-box-containing protein